MAAQKRDRRLKPMSPDRRHSGILSGRSQADTTKLAVGADNPRLWGFTC